MKTYAVVSILLLTLIASRLPRPTPHELTEADRARIEKEVSDFLSSYLQVIEGGEPEAVRALFVDDERFAWFTDGERRYTSAEEVLASLAGMEGMTLSTKASEVEIVPLTPDLAHARTAFHTKINQGGAVVYEFDGVSTWLLEDVQRGEWRVLRGHTSTPKKR